MPSYRAKVRTYTTESQDIWDIIAVRIYGDERCMHALQDANFEHRFVGFFPAEVELIVPLEVTIQEDLKPSTRIPDIKKLLPWR